jgi:hypothetical protein
LTDISAPTAQLLFKRTGQQFFLCDGATAAAAGGGVKFGDGFGVDGEWELYKSATGRSSSMKLPAIPGDTLKYSLQVRMAANYAGLRTDFHCS